MSIHPVSASSSSASASRPFANAALVTLLERIVEAGDGAALHELHDYRTVFRIWRQDRPMTLTEYVMQLCEAPWVQQLCGYDRLVIEQACELLLDRFSRLPPPGAPAGGADCRAYFASVLDAIRDTNSRDHGSSPLEREAAAARILQSRVTGHMWFSCLDARRCSNPRRTRYAWQLDGRAIHVWMPATIPGHERRRWLEDHVPNPDPHRPGERIRIQSIVNEQLGVPRFVTLPEDLPYCRRLPADEQPADSPEEAGEGAMDLAAYVADEKAERIGEQRPAIRALGPQRLKALIRQIFQNIEEGTYEEKILASLFGLSKATLSRFAGIRWHNSRRIPDLWLNTARTLAAHRPFIEVAINAGVWDRVIETLISRRKRDRKNRP